MIPRWSEGLLEAESGFEEAGVVNGLLPLDGRDAKVKGRVHLPDLARVLLIAGEVRE